MITITNAQRKYPVNVPMLKAAATAMLTELKYSDFDLGILICNGERMAEYNSGYRGKEGPTDILSFPYHDTLKAGERIEAESPEDKNIGDIILCPEIIEKKRHDWSRSFDDQCVVLLAHGIAHLLGHDHERDEEYVVMQALEDTLLAAAHRVSRI